MAVNAAMTYQSNKIATASKGELTLMLYEGTIKYCNLAIEGIKEKSIEKTNNNILRVERIITELQATLDVKYPVSNEFAKVYDYLYRRLVEANIRKDITILEEVLEHLREMRDTWKEVMRLTRQS